MKRTKPISFLTTVFFWGLILSMTVYLALGMALGGGKTEDGSFRFNQAFHGDGAIENFVRYWDYKAFRHIADENVIVGENDWLFEGMDVENGYDYLLDYLGGCPFSEEELALISAELDRREAICREAGADYRMVVIPNAMTACHRYLPEYLGNPSENRRLSVLSSYLREEGEGEETPILLDLTELMQNESVNKVLYNNTEDSINAYGAYAIYRAVLGSLAEANLADESMLITPDEVEFSIRHTEGKDIARRAGLSDVVRNRTVSLTEQMTEGYRITDAGEFCVATQRLDGAKEGEPRLVVELSEEWDRIQLMPFFSNTFGEVVYENTVNADCKSVSIHDGTVLIQVIHERELATLLEEAEAEEETETETETETEHANATERKNLSRSTEKGSDALPADPKYRTE